MSVTNGDELKIQVSATAIGTKTDVNDMNRYGKRKSRSVNRTPVFMRAAPYVSRGTKDYGFTISGLLNDADAGQQMLRDAEETGTSVFLTVLFDGTNGLMQEVLVSQLSHDADPENFQAYGFECQGVDEPVEVGTGPIV